MQQRFLEEQEQIAMGGEAKEQPTTCVEWLAIIGMMFIVYMFIVLLWIICMSGVVNGHFVATVASFMFVFFLIYIPTIAYLWYNGLQQREELIRKFIADKLKEQAVEIGSRV